MTQWEQDDIETGGLYAPLTFNQAMKHAKNKSVASAVVALKHLGLSNEAAYLVALASSVSTKLNQGGAI